MKRWRKPKTGPKSPYLSPFLWERGNGEWGFALRERIMGCILGIMVWVVGTKWC